jgi:thiol-disulfide isomerase/thioredoxin
MFKYVFVILLFSFELSVAQTAEVVKFDKIESIIKTTSDDIQVINFWATWCGPCVKELPLFNALAARQDEGVKITLVSVDYADKVGKVNSFITRNKLKPAVLLLDELDYNAWIDRVDPGWGGAIPATLFINTKTGQRKFVDKELKEGELEKYIQSLKN